MRGVVSINELDFHWWAGPASDEVDAAFCVHCRRGQYGVTEYHDRPLNDDQAAAVARVLAPAVEQVARTGSRGRA
ncbi:MAG: hypothetical protein AAF662_10650 [Pseudomonadota bacterium]